MAKIALNYNYGCFHLPIEVADEIIAKEGITYSNLLFITDRNRESGYTYCDDLKVRMHPATIAYFEEHDPKMLIEIPDNLKPNDLIRLDYDGIESVVEKGHIWEQEIE